MRPYEDAAVSDASAEPILERVDQVREALLDTVSNDEKNAGVINWCLSRADRGGWEAWLQVMYARQVGVKFEVGLFRREETFPTGQRCDLWFQPRDGLPIWVELKTQRNSEYQKTVADFKSDIQKLLDLHRDFRKNNVLAAMAVLRLRQDDIEPLEQLRSSGPGGRLSFLKYEQTQARWDDVTLRLRGQPPGATMCLTFVPT